MRAFRSLGIGVMVALLVWFAWFGRRGILSPGEARATAEAGAVFGQSTTDESCLGEALRRGAACRDDVRCEAESTAFLRGCLPASTPTPEFCDGVPPPAELLPSGTWSKRVWDAQGRPHHGGMIADAVVRAFCHAE